MNDLEERIIVTAKKQFIKNGYEQTNMSDIAIELGISRSSLHYYFRTKEKMFQAVIGSIFNEVIPQAKLVVSSSEPFIDKLDKLLDCYFKVYKDNPELLFFILSESRRDINMLRQLADDNGIKMYVDELLSMLNKEMENGNIRRVPMEYFAFHVLSQLIFPFIAKPIIMETVCYTEDNFSEMVAGWKSYILNEMKMYLV